MRIPILLLLIAVCFETATAQLRSHKVIKTAGNGTFATRVAAFGAPLNQTSLRFNLMTPPDSLVLCEFPNSFRGINERQETSPGDLPIALLVSIDECSTEDKVRVLQEIREDVHSKVQLLLIYSSLDSNVTSPRVILPRNPSAVDDLADVGILHLPYESAQFLSAVVDKQRASDNPNGNNPFLLQSGNAEWLMELTLENNTEGAGISQRQAIAFALLGFGGFMTLVYIVLLYVWRRQKLKRKQAAAGGRSGSRNSNNNTRIATDADGFPTLSPDEWVAFDNNSDDQGWGNSRSNR